MAVFTGILTVFSFLLYEINRQATSISLVTQRAVVSAGGIQSPFGMEVAAGKVTGYNFTVSLANSGATPTREAVYQVNLSFVDFSPYSGLDFEQLSQSEKVPFVFGPKSGIAPAPRTLSLGDMEAIENGKKHAFIWGWVAYRDRFPGTPIHLTEFCQEIDNPRWNKPEHADPSTVLTLALPPCPTYNCYDEDCQDYSLRVRALSSH